MRVLHVAEVSHGGVISLLRVFTSAQVEDGHDVHVLLPAGVEAPAGQVHRWSPRRRRPWSLVAATARLRSVVAELRPDIVHLHSFFPGLLGRCLPVPAEVAVVYQPHSWAFEAVGQRHARRAVVRWEVAASRRTDAVITNCADEWSEARAAGVVGPGRVVGLPVDTTRYRPATHDQQMQLRRKLRLDAPNVLVCVGRLSPQKGQEALVAEWEQRPLRDTVLVLVGPGDPSGLAELAPTTFGSSVQHIGAQQDVRPWIWAADICVQPSLYEGQSVAMAEALACGRPVIMTEVNGAREAIAPEEEVPAGTTVPVGDLGALLDACAVRLGPDRDQLIAESRAARNRALCLFDEALVLDRIEQTYRAAISSARSATVATPERALP